MIEEELKKEGYDNVYIWEAVPLEEDSDHNHDFDTKLAVLEGEIEIVVDGKKSLLKEGDSIEIPRNKIHSGKVGLGGCKYIVAEKH